MNKLNDDRRISLVRSIVCVFFIIGITMSWTLWHSSRLFPLCPIFDFMPASSEVLDFFLPVLLVLLLITGVFLRKQWIFGALFVILLFLLLQDQIRWQPWVYIYVFILLPFAILKRSDPKLLVYFQIIIIGVYLWSGLNKFNQGFIENTFDKMLRELFFMSDEVARVKYHFWGYLVPLIEVLIALGLVFKRTRTIAVVGAILTHVVILIYLNKRDINPIVYPWNVAMIGFVIVLFFKNTNSLNFFKWSDVRLKILSSTAALFFLVLPFLGVFNLWDNYLSFKLYSGAKNQFFVALPQDQLGSVDEELKDCLWNVNRVSGKYWIYVNKWAYDELNVPMYPSRRVFRQFARSYCRERAAVNLLDFYWFEKEFDTGPFEKFTCEDVCGDCD